MNYNDKLRIDALAADFVVGTMRGQARKRFQRLMMQQADVRKAVWFWEQQLNPMAENLPASAPDSEVWQRIKWRLGWEAVTPASARKVTSNDWANRALYALAASILVAVIMMSPLSTVDRQQEIAVFQTQDAKAWWLISKIDNEVAISATGSVVFEDAYDYELWMLPEDGSAPISIGLLPQRGSQRLAWPLAAQQLNIAALAVSLEPIGGSPIGSPTGPVLFTAEFLTL